MNKVRYLSLLIIMSALLFLPLDLTVCIHQSLTWRSSRLVWSCLRNLVQNLLFESPLHKYPLRLWFSLQCILKCRLIPGIAIYLVYDIYRTYNVLKYLLFLLGMIPRCFFVSFQWCCWIIFHYLIYSAGETRVWGINFT